MRGMKIGASLAGARPNRLEAGFTWPMPHGEEFLKAPQAFFDPVDRSGIGDSQIAWRTEGVSGHDDQVLPLQELFRQHGRIGDAIAQVLGNAREGIKRAARLDAGDSGIARSPATMRSRRREYSASMAATVSIGPVSASSARTGRLSRIRRGLALQLDHRGDQLGGASA